MVRADENAIDFSDIEKKYSLPEPDYFGNIVIVDNLPVVDESKAPKLLNVIKKIFGAFGRIKDTEMPMGADNKMSKG
jgi:translation initiation factor 3 subunit B